MNTDKHRWKENELQSFFYPCSSVFIGGCLIFLKSIAGRRWLNYKT